MDYSKHPHSNIARTIHCSSLFSCQRLCGIAKNLISCSTPLRTYLRVDSTVETKECYPNLEGEEIISDTLQNVTISPVQNKMVSSLFLSMKIHALVSQNGTLNLSRLFEHTCGPETARVSGFDSIPFPGSPRYFARPSTTMLEPSCSTWEKGWNPRDRGREGSDQYDNMTILICLTLFNSLATLGEATSEYYLIGRKVWEKRCWDHSTPRLAVAKELCTRNVAAQAWLR